MNRSKASAALLRLKDIDKKYRARYEDPKQELSSDNTESLLRQPAESKTDTPEPSVTEKQEISKPTLNIKIPDTFTEQLESQSSSNEVSPSLRVSIVDKTPIATPRIKTQSISEIQEELEEAESISEVLEHSDNSDSETIRKSPKEEIEKSESKNMSLSIAGKNLSTEEKLQNRVSFSNDTQSNDYSHDSFESYSSVSEISNSTHSHTAETQSKILLQSDIHEVTKSISVHNTNKNDALFGSKRITDTRKLTKSIENKRTANFAENIEERKEEKATKLSDNIEKRNEEKITEFAESTEKTNEVKTAKFAENIEVIKEVKAANFAESIEKTKEEKTASICENTDESDEIVNESSKSVQATDSFGSSSAKSEAVVGTLHEKLKSKRSKRKNSKTKKQRKQEDSSFIENENSFDKKLPRNESKQKDVEDIEKCVITEEFSTSLESQNSLQQKSEEDISEEKILKVNDDLESEKEFSLLKNKIFSREKTERKGNKRNDSANGTVEMDKSGISSSSLLITNSCVIKSGRDRRTPADLELADKIEKEEQTSSSAKMPSFSHKKVDNNETALFIRAHTSSQLLRETNRYRKKSRDCSKGVGIVPAVGAGLSESSSRRISSQRKTEHCKLAFKQRDAEKGSSKTIDNTARKSRSAVQIGETGERIIKFKSIKRRNLYHNSKVYEDTKKNKHGAETSKSSTYCRVNEVRHAREDMELERFKMRMSELRLEQERQLMLCYMRNFEEDRGRLAVWPNQCYCAGKPEIAIVKPLNFPNVLKFVKPDSTLVKPGLVFPDNHMAMLRERVLEIRQWLKDQFILYQDYSDVAASINAKYVAETEKIFMPSRFFRFSLNRTRVHTVLRKDYLKYFIFIYLELYWCTIVVIPEKWLPVSKFHKLRARTLPFLFEKLGLEACTLAVIRA